MSCTESVKFSWTRTLLTLICLLVCKHNDNSDLMVLQYSPVLLLGLPPVVEAEHDGEGAGGQQLLVVVVVQTVSCCQGKSVANLGGKRLMTRI